MRSKARNPSPSDGGIAASLAALTPKDSCLVPGEHRKFVDQLNGLCIRDRDAVVSHLRTLLHDDPHVVVVSEPALLGALSLVAPREVRSLLLEYLAVIKEPTNGLAEAVICHLSRLPRSTYLEKIAQLLDIVDEEMRAFLLSRLHLMVETGSSRTVRDAVQLVDRHWSQVPAAQRAAILFALCQVPVDDDLLPGWRDRAYQTLPHCQSPGEIYLVLSFCLKYCRDEEAATCMIEHFRVHITLRHLASSTPPPNETVDAERSLVKRSKTSGCRHRRVRLQDLIVLIKKCRLASDAMKKWIANSPSALSYLMCLLLGRFPGETKFVLGILEKVTDSTHAHLVEAASLLLGNDASFASPIIQLANLCAKRGSLEAAGVLFTAAVQSTEVFVAWGLLSEFTGYITDSSSSAWALKILARLVGECPHLLARNRSALLVVMDHLEQLSSEGVREYYECLLQVAAFCCEQQGDPSLWNDLQIIFRKQASTLDPRVRMYGATAILAMLHVLFSKQDVTELSDEPTCSQAPLHQSSRSARFTEQFLAIFDLATSRLNCDVTSLVHLMMGMTPLLAGLEDQMVKSLNKKTAALFEESFIYELSKPPPSTGGKPLHNIDGEDALIGICFFEKGSVAMGLAAPHIFHFLQATEKHLHAGTLDNIDALLGCPILLPEGEQKRRPALHHLTLINWLRILLNAFWDQDDKEIQRKCALRLQLLSALSEDMDDSDASRLLESASSLAAAGLPSLGQAGGDPHHHPPIETVEDSELCAFLASVTIKSPSAAPKPATGKKRGGESPHARSCSRLLPLDVAVYLRYLGSESGAEFLLWDLLATAESTISSWPEAELSKLTRLLCTGPWSQTRLQVILHLFRVLSQQQSSDVPKISLCLASLRSPADMRGDELTLLLDVPIISKSVFGWELVCDQGIEYCFSGSSSALEAETILEKILLMHQWNPDLMEILHSRYISTGFSVEKKKLAIHQVFCKALASMPINSIDDIQKAIGIFDVRIQLARNGVEEGYADGALRFGRLFIERFTKTGLPLLQRCFLERRTKVLEMMKQLQTCTRSLQIICNHLKPRREAKYRSLLPPLRKALEALLFGVKQMLQAHNCLAAFWMGNLKHRAIDGAETSSQVSVEAPSSPSSSSEGGDPHQESTLALSKEIIDDSDAESGPEEASGADPP